MSISLLRYHGGKSRSTHLMSFFPLEPITHYMEPFAGGAGIFWSVDVRVKRWLNDIDEMLMKLYRCAKSDPDFCKRLAKIVRSIETADDQWKQFHLARLDFKINRDPYAYWLLNRVAYGCYVSVARNNAATLSWNTIRNGFAPFDRPGRAKEIVQKLAGVRLTCWDWKRAIQKSNKNTFLFIDAPYHCEGQIYGHELTIDEHEDLAHFLSAEQRQWLQTIGYSELSKRLYKNKSWCRCLFRKYTKTATAHTCGQEAQELIIRNYD